jgi:hypothetical protein
MMHDRNTTAHGQCERSRRSEGFPAQLNCRVCHLGPCRLGIGEPAVNIWVSDFGEIRLPAEFPLHIFRKDGWWDGRYKAMREKWEPWIEAEEAKLRAPISFHYTNRPHGAAVNKRGEAI